MTVVVTGTNVGVYLAPLHMRLGFRLLKDLGLSAPTISYFCENSYDEYITAERHKVEQQRPVDEEIMERAKAAPQISAILRSLENKGSKESPSEVQWEVRTYTVPDQAKQTVAPFDSWNEEKKHLFERILVIARKEVERVFCESGKSTTITVPDFSVGDPSIYLLVEPPSGDESSIDETSILSIQFTRNDSTGEYDGYLGKTFGLPDELNWYRPLIEKRGAKELSIICRKKRLR
jgi:hypothetical protein